MDLVVVGLDTDALSIAAAFCELGHAVQVVCDDELAVRRQQRGAHCRDSDEVEWALRRAQEDRLIRFTGNPDPADGPTILVPSTGTLNGATRRLIATMSDTPPVLVEIGALPPTEPILASGALRAASPIMRSNATLLEDIRRQPRFVVGADDEVAIRRLESLYRPLTRKTVPLVVQPDATSAWLMACAGLVSAAIQDRLESELGQTRSPNATRTPQMSRRALDFVLAHDRSGQSRPLLEGLRVALTLQEKKPPAVPAQALRDR